MDKEIAKAFSDLNNKVNEAQKKLNEILSGRCDNNANEIQQLTTDLDDVASNLTEMELNQADMLMNICMLELGIESDDLFFEEEDEEDDSENNTPMEGEENE